MKTPIMIYDLFKAWVQEHYRTSKSGKKIKIKGYYSKRQTREHEEVSPSKVTYRWINGGIETKKNGKVIKFVRDQIPEIDKKQYKSYMKENGIGPCGSIAFVLREMGFGEIEVGFVGKKGDYEKSVPHYWIRTSEGKILDNNAKYFLEGTTMEKDHEYWDVEKIPHNEEPDTNLWNEKDYNEWRGKIHLG